MACLGGGSKISKSSDNIKPPVIEQLSQDDLNAMADKLNDMFHDESDFEDDDESEESEE